MKFSDFDTMMRRFELSLDEQVSDLDWIVLRLDGRGFTKLTKEVLDFTRPFDLRFHEAMQKTCTHLMTSGIKFALCYTQSDEISLLLSGEDIPFAGKTRKLNSVFAGEASGVFSLSLGRPVAFDCRVVPLGKIANVVDYFRWRAEDAHRNSLTAFCYWSLRETGMPPGEADARMNGLSKAEKLNLLSELKVDFAVQPDWMRLGAFARWKTTEHLGTDPRTGENVPAMRQLLEWVTPTPEGKAIDSLIKEISPIKHQS